jgi:hypothetical protein
MKLIAMTVKEYAAILRAIEVLDSDLSVCNPEDEKGYENDHETLTGLARKFDTVKQ